MPVPKKISTAVEKVELPSGIERVDALPADQEAAPVGDVTDRERHEFDLRRVALELAISAREPEPVRAAPAYYAFLAGAEKTTAEVPA